MGWTDRSAEVVCVALSRAPDSLQVRSIRPEIFYRFCFTVGTLARSALQSDLLLLELLQEFERTDHRSMTFIIRHGLAMTQRPLTVPQDPRQQRAELHGDNELSGGASAHDL